MVTVLRVYHAGRDRAHRARDRALYAAGVDLTLLVPSTWPDAGSEAVLSPEPFRVVELDVRRSGDVNRHAYADPSELRRLVAAVRPDVIDVHEEPVSLVARQWLTAAGDRPVVMYTAQNLDKRFPPPFAQFERQSLRRVRALYPCTCQAASVARGKGFAGPVDVLPLGYDPDCYRPGDQSLSDGTVVLGLVGRLVPEKGALDAVRVLAALRRARPARLVVIGAGPDLNPARILAAKLGVSDAVELLPWGTPTDLAAAYRRMHVVLVPSRTTDTWVEQFGRVIVEAQASGAVVAAYGSGSIPEVAGPAALLAQTGRLDELAGLVVALAQDAADWQRRRAKGLDATRDLTWDRVAQRQAALYERVLAHPVRLRPPPTAAARRTAARMEFGPPAATPAGERPFALPYLRRASPAARALEKLTDGVVHLSERWRHPPP